MKNSKFIAILRNGKGGIGYIAEPFDDYKRTVEFGICRRIENATKFNSYSEAMDALLATDTTGWKFSEIETASEEV
jgi:hypothetical protein